MSIEVLQYVRPDGSCPFRTWFGRLDVLAAAKVATAAARIGSGNLSKIKWFGGIGEYVIDWGPGYRLYLAKDGDAIVVLFAGGTKRRQQNDIDMAFALHAEYKQRKRLAQ